MRNVFSNCEKLLPLVLRTRPSLQPGYLRGMLPDSAPDHPESLEDIFNGKFFKTGFLHFLKYCIINKQFFVFFFFNF